MMTADDSPARSTPTVAPVRPTLLDTIEGRDNNYTLIRLVLASSVIYFHAFALSADTRFVDYLSPLVYPPTSVGGLAVQCFFFLSGLFVAQSYHDGNSFVGFALRRAFRIWPGLFVCLVVTTILACAISQPASAWRYLLHPDFHDYIATNARLGTMLFVPDVYPQNRLQGLNGPLYTLRVEAWMYVILGIAGLVGLLRTKPRIVAIASVLLAVAMLRPTTFTAPLRVVEYGQYLIAMFFAGMLAFGLAAKIRIAGWQCLPLLAWLASGWLHTLAFFAVAIWVMLYVGQSPLLRRWVQPKSDASYGVYIYGWPCQQFVAAADPDINPYLMMAVALPMAWLFASASWRLIEKPGIALGRQLAERWTHLTASPAARTPFPGRALTGWRRIVLLLVMLAAIKAAPVLLDRLPPPPTVEMPVRIVGFGPRTSPAGASFNVQPGGHSAMWIRLDAPAPEGTRIRFAGTLLTTTLRDRSVTGRVPAGLLAEPGERIVCLERRGVEFLQRSDCVRMTITAPGAKP